MNEVMCFLTTNVLILIFFSVVVPPINTFTMMLTVFQISLLSLTV